MIRFILIHIIKIHELIKISKILINHKNKLNVKKYIIKFQNQLIN